MPHDPGVVRRLAALVQEGGPEIRCLDCKSVIRSRTRHDYVTCKCGNVSVDGGSAYTKIATQPDARWERVEQLKGTDP